MAVVTKDLVIQKLRQVIDPHTGGNVFDMGLVEDLTVSDEAIALRFVLTSNFCPIGMQLGMALKRKLRELPAQRIDVTIGNYLRAAELEQLLATI